MAASASALWPAGTYHWSACVAATVGGVAERYEVATGTLVVAANLAAKGAGYDGRGHVKIVLDAIEAVIEGRASKDQESYSIAGRSLSRTPIPQLLALRDKYRAEYRREQAAAKVAAGTGGMPRVLTRL